MAGRTEETIVSVADVFRPRDAGIQANPGTRESAGHLFLTGEIQVGKSTIINRVLAELNVPVSGFRTVAVPNGCGASDIYLIDAADASPDFSQECCLARRTPGKKPEVYEEVFLSRGVPLLARASGAVIVMDELGWMESSSHAFQEAVFSVLCGPVPVLGVVRDKDLPFLNAVRSHPSVELLTITRENQEEITGVVREKVRAALR